MYQQIYLLAQNYYRDPNGWYHIVFQGTGTLLLMTELLYVNGEQITDFDIRN